MKKTTQKPLPVPINIRKFESTSDITGSSIMSVSKNLNIHVCWIQVALLRKI